MDPSYCNKKILDLSDAELIAIGFVGDNVAPGVKCIVDRVKANPAKLGGVTCLAVHCLKEEANQRSQKGDTAQPSDFSTSPTSLTSPTSNYAETPSSAFNSTSSARTIVPPNLMSEYEMTFYYHGISGDLPKLLWRSNAKSDPSPIPPPRAHFFNIPQKTAHGVFKTRLNELWDSTVVPQIKAVIKNRGLFYSAIKTARFSIIEDVEDGKEERFGPVITGVVVEWYEGSVVRLAGPPLMKVEGRTNAKSGLNHPFNNGLGIPIAMHSDDAQGTLTFLFEEGKTVDGKPSDKILALTTKHVASLDATTDYVLDVANPQHILVCGDRRINTAIAEIQEAVTTGLCEADTLVEEFADTPEHDRSAAQRVTNALDDKNEHNNNIEALFNDVDTNWRDTNGRRFGVVDWAPPISATVDDPHYTRDIATFAVDKEKLGDFEKNVVDLGNQYTAFQLTQMFWPIAAVRERKRIPASLQLPIRAALTRRSILNPDTEDENGEPLYIVGK